MPFAEPSAATPSSACPPATCATVIAPAPGWGMVFTLMPVPPMNDMAATHQLCPTPAVAMFNLPGFAFACLIASWIVFRCRGVLVDAITMGKKVA